MKLIDIGMPMGRLAKNPNSLLCNGRAWPKAKLCEISWIARKKIRCRQFFLSLLFNFLLVLFRKKKKFFISFYFIRSCRQVDYYLILFKSFHAIQQKAINSNFFLNSKKMKKKHIFLIDSLQFIVL